MCAERYLLLIVLLFELIIMSCNCGSEKMAKLSNDKIAVQEAKLALVKHQQSMVAMREKEAELKNNVKSALAKVKK